MTSKIIIQNNTDLTDYEALLYVIVVIKQGKLSKTSRGKQYSFATIFKDNIVVTSGRKNNTYVFMVEKREDNVE